MIRKATARRDQRGHLMVAVMVTVALMGILTALAMPAWTDVKRRDDEAEMMFRAQEIARGIFKYNNDQGGAPLLELEQLAEKGNRQQYFIRKLYKDPLTKDGKWGLLYAGPDGGIYDPNSATGSAGPLLGDQAPLEGYGGLDTNPEGQPREAAGLPIIGVKSLCTDKPFRVYKGLTEYSEWLFTIRDVAPMAQGQQAGGSGQQQRNNPTAPRSRSNPLSGRSGGR